MTLSQMIVQFQHKKQQCQYYLPMFLTSFLLLFIPKQDHVFAMEKFAAEIGSSINFCKNMKNEVYRTSNAKICACALP